jgi:hypothetical protein
VNKAVRDTRARKIRVYRYRCCRCKRTFRHYPEGVTRADQGDESPLFLLGDSATQVPALVLGVSAT